MDETRLLCVNCRCLQPPDQKIEEKCINHSCRGKLIKTRITPANLERWQKLQEEVLARQGKCALATIFGDSWCHGGKEEDSLCQKCSLLQKR